MSVLAPEQYAVYLITDNPSRYAGDFLENVEAAVSQTGLDTRLPVGLLYRQDLAENAGIGLHTLLGQLSVDGLADPVCPILIRITSFQKNGKRIFPGYRYKFP